MWKNIVDPDRSQMTIWRIRFACWVIKARDTHTQNMQYLLLLYGNNGCKNASQCYNTRILPVMATVAHFYKAMFYKLLFNGGRRG
jgi:hypothetical protein